LDLINTPSTKIYENLSISIEEFDDKNQSSWNFPDTYKNMDIAKYILDQCKNDEELQRVGKELLLYQEKDMFMLLKYLKYLVDTMRENNIVWGVGRGSSVSSFVLFLLGVHKINSLYYDLEIEEFLK
jgi:DNA polymerase III alpha subunit